MQWSDVAKMRDKFNRTGECDFCENAGLVMGVISYGGHQVAQGFPCSVCGQYHGYVDYVKNKYAEGTSKGSHIVGNIFAFPSDKRNIQMDNEFIGNNGIIPIKSKDGNNVLSIEEFRKRGDS